MDARDSFLCCTTCVQVGIYTKDGKLISLSLHVVGNVPKFRKYFYYIPQVALCSDSPALFCKVQKLLLCEEFAFSKMIFTLALECNKFDSQLVQKLDSQFDSQVLSSIHSSI